MIERILVPLDGSLTAAGVLPQVRRILKRVDAEVILLRVADPPPVDSLYVFDAALTAAREYLMGLQERLIEEGVRARSIARLGGPAGTILDIAEEEKVSLIAMATHGHTGLARLAFGSVAEAVLRSSPVPVFTVRPFWAYEVVDPKWENRPIRNILLPLDGSDLSRSAVPHAVEFAKLFGARAVLFHALDPKAAEKVFDRDQAGRQLREVAETFTTAGVKALTLVDEGPAAAVILRVCRFHEIDLIAMSTHGRSGIPRLVTGSVTEEILRRATVPLLAVRGVRVEKEAVAGAPL